MSSRNSLLESYYSHCERCNKVTEYEFSQYSPGRPIEKIFACSVCLKQVEESELEKLTEEGKKIA